MTTLIMLHGAAQTPLVWRRVADRISPSWAIVAPDLHRCENLDAVLRTVEQDLDVVGATAPIVVVADGEAASYALQVALKVAVDGVFFTDPRFRVRHGQLAAAKLAAAMRKGKRVPPTVANPAQTLQYLQVLHDVTSEVAALVNEQLARLGRDVPASVVYAQRERRSVLGQAEVTALVDAGVKPYAIEGASSGWNDYAPEVYAANIIEFVTEQC